MEKHIDVMRKSLDLAETVLQGLEYVQKKLRAGKFEDTFNMLNDVVNGIYSIEKAIEPILKDLPENEIQNLTAKLRNALDVLVSAYEQKEFNKALEIMQFNLMPAYQKWQKELNCHFQPYVIF